MYNLRPRREHYIASWKDSIRFKIHDFMRRNPATTLDSSEIIYFLSLCNEYRTSYDELPDNFFRKVLHYIAERMFLSGFSESSYVVFLLELMYEANHYLTIISPNSDRYTALIAVEHHEYVGYFLSHTYNQKTLFSGFRMPCTEVCNGFYWMHPVELAAWYPDPLLLHQLLRYGALLSFDTNYINPDFKRGPYGWNGMFALKSVIASILAIKSDLLPAENSTLNSKYSEKYFKYICCCKLLLCDLPRWTPKWSEKVPFMLDIYYEEELLRKSGKVLEFISFFSANVVPSFEKHFTQPFTLKQSCRLSARRTLNEKWLLPRGIYTLHIPEKLKLYLDLYYE